MAKKKLGTKDVKVGGGGTPKTLQPGNTVAKINSIRHEEFELKEGALIVILSLEGTPLPDFEGFLVDKDDPEGPRYKGQVGNVKAGEWAFADGETKSGIQIDRDTEILKFLKSLCIALNCVKWFDDEDGKHETIESLLTAFDKSKVYEGIYLDICLGGKEYLNRNNYTNYDLFFPKYTRAGAPFGPICTDPASSKVVKYDESVHIKRKKVTKVDSFESDSAPMDTESAGEEFDL